jgi:transcriptional regulator with XRE-family HTH domain
MQQPAIDDPQVSLEDDGANAEKSIGARLRFWRRTVNMSPRELARALDITYQQLQKYEKGINRISASRLHKAASVLRVPIDFFYDDQLTRDVLPHACSGEGLPSAVTDYDGMKAAAELWNIFNRITNQLARKAILHLMAELAGNEPQVAPARATSGTTSESDSRNVS